MCDMAPREISISGRLNLSGPGGEISHLLRVDHVRQHLLRLTPDRDGAFQSPGTLLRQPHRPTAQVGFD